MSNATIRSNILVHFLILYHLPDLARLTRVGLATTLRIQGSPCKGTAHGGLFRLCEAFLTHQAKELETATDGIDFIQDAFARTYLNLQRSDVRQIPGICRETSNWGEYTK